MNVTVPKYRGRIRVKSARVEENPADGSRSVKVTYEFSGPENEA